jgi:hypothetical protein
MSDLTSRPPGKLPAGPAEGKSGTDEGQKIPFSDPEHREYFEAVRALHRSLSGRVGEVEGLRRQVAELAALVCHFRDAMTDLFAQALRLSQRMERSLDRERHFWEQFGGQLFDVMAGGADTLHGTLLRLAEQIEGRVEARQADNKPRLLELKEAFEATFRDYKDLVSRRDEAADRDATGAAELEQERSGEDGTRDTEEDEDPAGPPGPPPDPIEQLGVVVAWRRLEQAASRVGRECWSRWPEAAPELDVIPQTIRHLEQKLQEDRALEEEVRGKSLAEAAERRSSSLIGTLCKLDVLVSGRSERNLSQRLPEAPLREEVKKVRDLLFDFMNKFGGWREFSVEKGQSALQYRGKVDPVGPSSAGQQIIQEVLHPGYIKEGESEPRRKPRVILSH